MKKIFSVMCAVLMISVLAGCSKKAEKGEFTVEKGKLMIAMEVGYPPFEYYADDGKTPIGFDVQLGKAIASRLGLEPVFIDTAWDGIFAGLDTDRYDVVMSAATITEERLNNYTFSNPYIGNGQAIILQKDSKLNIKEFKDLAGLKIGYQAETTSDFYTKKHSAALGFTYVENAYDKVMNAYDDLKLKRIDAVVSDSLVAVDYLSVPNSEFKQVWAAEPDEYFGVCMKKGNTELQGKINKILDEMKADGSLKKIYFDIFGMDLSDSIK
ncbi:MAG: ABC transporter substrate-binding protein [Treponema sp.]|nr:ABC transporter substrate-binding protein [Treponema sp.]